MPELKTGIYRSFKIARDKISDKDRTIELAFSSEEPVERWGENEVLGHEKGEYDFSRLNNAHPLLLGHEEHDPESQIGVIESARVDSDKVGRALVRFGDSPKAEQTFKDVKNGIRVHVSVGYDRTGIVESKKSSNGMMTTRYRWIPSHIALVPVPADTTVGVGRMKKRLCPDCDGDGVCPYCGGGSANDPDGDEDKACEHCRGSGKCQGCGGDGYIETAKSKSVDSQLKSKEQVKIMSTTVDEKELRANAAKEAREALQNRRKELRLRGDNILKDFPAGADKIRQIIEEAIETDEDVEKVSYRMLREAGQIKPAKIITMEGLGMSQREQGCYSVGRAIQSVVKRAKPGSKEAPLPDGLEGEVHEAMAQRDLGFSPGGFLIPCDAPISSRTLSRRDRRRMGRDMQVNIFGQGGATVPTILTVPIIELLRNRMVTKRLGVRELAGLEGNILIPRQTAAGTAYSVSEIAPLTISNQQIDQIAVLPHRVGAMGQYSKQLVIQSALDVESFIRDDLMKVIAIDWDRLIIAGQGANSEPLGILNTPGIGSVTFGASATYAKLVSFHTAVAAANADVGDMAFVTTPTTEGAWRSEAKLLTGATTVAAFALWEGPFEADSPDGIAAGYRAASTNQVPGNLAMFGVWDEILHCIWGGFDVVVDPFSQAPNAEIRIVMNTWGDVAVRHPQCFAVSSDSGAQ